MAGRSGSDVLVLAEFGGAEGEAGVDGRGHEGMRGEERLERTLRVRVVVVVRVVVRVGAESHRERRVRMRRWRQKSVRGLQDGGPRGAG